MGVVQGDMAGGVRSDDIWWITMPVHFWFKRVDLLIAGVLPLAAKSLTVMYKGAAADFLSCPLPNADDSHAVSSSIYSSSF